MVSEQNPVYKKKGRAKENPPSEDENVNPGVASKASAYKEEISEIPIRNIN